MAQVLIWLVRLYQRTLSRILPPMCRFTPTCSEYMIRALRVHGAWRGFFMGCMRILRCNPLNPGGYDPVPGDPDIQTANKSTESHNGMTEK